MGVLGQIYPVLALSPVWELPILLPFSTGDGVPSDHTKESAELAVAKPLEALGMLVGGSEAHFSQGCV